MNRESHELEARSCNEAEPRVSRTRELRITLLSNILLPGRSPTSGSCLTLPTSTSPSPGFRGESGDHRGGGSAGPRFQDDVYDNPVNNVAMTFVEVFPIELAVSLLSAAILRRSDGTRTA